MKIAIISASSEEQKFLTEALGQEHELSFIPNLGPVEITQIRDFEILSLLIYTRVDESLLSRLPNLKFVTTRSTGFDHINLAACQKHDVIAANIPSYSERSVAELAIGLMLNLARNIHLAYEITRHGNFSSTNLLGCELKHKTLGIVGLGRIGKQVAVLARGLGMEVVASDPYPDQDFAKKHSLTFSDLKTLLPRADFVTLHVLENGQTHHLMNKKTFSLMKEGAYLINAARGETVNNEDLLEALRSKKIAGAALDVFEGEKDLKGNVVSGPAFKLHAQLMEFNVLHTPHIAALTREAQAQARQVHLDNLRAFMAGHPINTL